jgi:hypothetical protein
MKDKQLKTSVINTGLVVLPVEILFTLPGTLTSKERYIELYSSYVSWMTIGKRAVNQRSLIVRSIESNKVAPSLFSLPPLI